MELSREITGCWITLSRVSFQAGAKRSETSCCHRLMWAYCSTPYSSTQETLNLLIPCRKIRVPKHLKYHVPAPEFPLNEYMEKFIKKWKGLMKPCKKNSGQYRHNVQRSPLYWVGDWVLIVSYCRYCGQSAKLQPKFVGPYCVVKVLPNHTSRVEHSEQISV